MTGKRYAEIDEEEYGAYWIVDVTNCDKTKKDFPDKDYPDDIIDIYAYEKYIQENGKVLESEEATELLNNLQEENFELKQALLYYMDCAISEWSSTFDKDMEELCKAVFDCSHEEAEKKYGDFNPYEKWGLEK